MRGGATGLTFSYGERPQGAAWGVEGAATGLAVRFWGETSTHFRPYSVEIVLHGSAPPPPPPRAPRAVSTSPRRRHEPSPSPSAVGPTPPHGR